MDNTQAEKIRALEAEVAASQRLIEQIQFSAQGYCPACGGWMVSPNGCTPKAHTTDCPIAMTIAATQSPRSEAAKHPKLNAHGDSV